MNSRPLGFGKPVPPAPAASIGVDRPGTAGPGVVAAAVVPPSAMPVPAPPLAEGIGGAVGWPLLDFSEFGPLTAAVPSARRHARQVLTGWERHQAIEPASLIVSELVTNSVAASRILRAACPVRLWLAASQARILIMVADASPGLPARADPDLDADGGRGLALVEAISSRWGWHPWEEHGMVKAVWAELVTSPGPTRP